MDAEMTLHDAAMTRFGQWWKRNVRAGHAYAQGFALHGQPPERFRERELKSIKKWAVLPIFATCVVIGGIAAVSPRWFGLGFLVLLVYPLLAVKVAVGRVKRRNSIFEALLYGTSVVIGKFPQWLGVWRFATASKRGERIKIIEYKGARG
jgi:hypothetical protein